jgi:hypothetical protein
MAKTQNKNGSMGVTSYGAFSMNSKQQTGHSRQEETNFKDVDQFKDPEQLKAYVLSLMTEIKSNGHASSHPTILNGESVDHVLKDTEKYRKECANIQKQLSDLRVQSETQKRAIDRIGGFPTMKAL